MTCEIILITKIKNTHLYNIKQSQLVLYIIININEKFTIMHIESL